MTDKDYKSYKYTQCKPKKEQRKVTILAFFILSLFLLTGVINLVNELNEMREITRSVCSYVDRDDKILDSSCRVAGL